MPRKLSRKLPKRKYNKKKVSLKGGWGKPKTTPKPKTKPRKNLKGDGWGGTTTQVITYK